VWPALAGARVLARMFAVLADYSDADWTTLMSLLRWLLANPRSGHTLRTIPVEGLDTKWLDASRRPVVESLLAVDERGVAFQRAVDLDDFARNGGVDFARRFHALDNARLSAAFHLRANFGQLDIDNIAQRLLRVIGHANDGNIAFNFDVLMIVAEKNLAHVNLSCSWV
jgi:hypothetical protein